MEVFVAFPGMRGPLQVWLKDGASSLVDDLSTKIFARVSSDQGLSPTRFERWHRATRLSTLGGRCALRSGKRLFECGIGQECRYATVCVMLRLVGGIDFQNRVGSKPGSGGVMSSEQANIDRRERLRKLALETVDLNKDPYFMRNHLGTYECKLCLTLHNTEGVR